MAIGNSSNYAILMKACQELWDGEPEKALATYPIHRLRSHSPRVSESQIMLARRLTVGIEAAHARGDLEYLEEAKALLMREQPYCSFDCDPHEYMARILVENGRYEQALQLLGQAEEIAGPSPPRPGVEMRRPRLLNLTRAEALISLNRLEEARQCINFDLSKSSDGFCESPLRKQELLWSFCRREIVKARLRYHRGEKMKAGQCTDPEVACHLPPIYRPIHFLQAAILEARFGHPEWAVRLHGMAKGIGYFASLISKLECTVEAEIALAEGDVERALGSFHALATTSHVDGVAYLRAADLAKNQGLDTDRRLFLKQAKALDPESHAAKVAETQLQTP